MKEKQTAEEVLKSKGITPLTKHHDYDYLYCSVVDLLQEKDKEIESLKDRVIFYNEKMTEAINEHVAAKKEIEELTRSRDDVFHELEGTKEHNKQLQEEIERLKGENEKLASVISDVIRKHSIKDDIDFNY